MKIRHLYWKIYSAW